MPIKAPRKKIKSKASLAKTASFTFKQALDASPAEVFRAFTHPTALRDWFCQTAQVSAHQGGGLYFGWPTGHAMRGELLTYDPPKKLVFTWDARDEPEPGRVTVSLVANGKGTRVTVSHQGLGSGAKWAGALPVVQRIWTEGLENLKSVLETGIDLRQARRPRLGIILGEFNAEIAKQLGVPAKDGIRLEGTLEGSGARAAGLQKDDVIVKFGGQNVNLVTLGAVVPNYKAGDKVPIGFYRGSEKKTVLLELSRFPQLDVPATAAELAETVRKNYVTINAALEQALAGVTEAQGDHKAGNEWSVKELLAHFIACERDFQSWLADMLNDTPVEDSLQMRPNVNERLRALVERYRTFPALIVALKQAQAETVALLADLPAAFVARKHLYRRAAGWMIETVPSHYGDEHAGQLGAALAAARGA